MKIEARNIFGVRFDFDASECGARVVMNLSIASFPIVGMLMVGGFIAVKDIVFYLFIPVLVLSIFMYLKLSKQ